MPWTSLCDLDELKEGQGKYVEIGGFQLGVFLDGGKVFVLDNYCPHAGGNLAGGFIRDGCVLCPWHSWAFRLDNGQLRDTPGVAIKAYRSRTVTPLSSSAVIVQADLPIF